MDNGERGVALAKEGRDDYALLPPPEDDQVEFDFLDWTVRMLRLLWRERRSVLRWTLVTAILAALAAFLIPTRYDSSAQLMPPKEGSDGTAGLIAALSAKGSDGMGVVAQNFLGIKTTGALFIGVMRSRTVEDRLVDQFNLREVYGTRTREDARKKLQKRTDLNEDRKSGLITVTVSDHDPQRAKGMATAYVEELNRLVVGLTTSSAHRERVFIEERLQSVKQDLETAEKNLSVFSSHNAVGFDLKDQSRAMVSAAADVQGQLMAAESQLQGLEQIYTDSNVRVRSQRARVAELRRQLQKLAGPQGDSNASASGSADDSSLYPSLRRLPYVGATYVDLYRRAKIQEAIYEYLTKQYEMAKVNEAKEIPSVRVLDQPEVPEKKSFPPRLLIISLGVVLGFLLGTVVATWREKWPQIPAHHPGRMLVEDAYRHIRTLAPVASVLNRARRVRVPSEVPPQREP